MKKKRSWPLQLISVCLLWTLAAIPARAEDIKGLAAQLAMKIRAAKHERVTVLDFVDLDQKPSKLGKFLAQQLSSALGDEEHQLVIVDQSELPQLYDQIAKLNDGLVDPATKAELGKVTGTEVIVVGTVATSSLTVKVDVKAIEVQTAKMIPGTGKNASVTRLGGTVEKLASEAEGRDMEEDEPSSPVKAAKKEKLKAPPTVKRDQNMQFELEGCELEVGDLTCSLTLTNGAPDRKIAVGLESRSWDDQGGEHASSSVSIANSTSERDCLRKDVLKDVPTRFSLTFPGFGEDSEEVAQLRIFWSPNNEGCYSNSWRTVQFTNIPLSEGGSLAFSSHSGKKSTKSETPTLSGKGGLLNKFGAKALQMLESTATQMLEKEKAKFLGEEEEEATPKPKKKKQASSDDGR